MLRTFVGNLAVLAAWTILSLTSLALTPAPGAAEDDEPDLARGRTLFALCTQCHGSDGGGNHAALAPAIAGLPQWYLESQLRKFRDGIRGLHHKDTGGLRMYPMSQWLREDDDVEAVAAYVASLPTPEIENVLEEPGDPQKGQGYYAVCTACHGAQGEGNQGMGAPPLVGMNDWYLESSIQKYKSGVRGSGKGDSLGAAMIGMVATLPDEQAIRDVIAYIETLEGQD